LRAKPAPVDPFHATNAGGVACRARC
jgi:hypothetical protein